MFWKKDSFKLKIKGRAGLIYSESGKVLKIDSEMLTGPEYDMVVYASSISHWEHPHDSELLSDPEKQRVKINILSKLAESKIKVDWVEN